MNRYKSSSKIKPQQSATIIFEDDFQQIQAQEIPVIDNLRYKSIPSKATLVLADQALYSEQSNPNFYEKPLDELKLVSTESTEKIKLNNFFGSKNSLQRKTQISSEQQLNPQKKTHRPSVEEEDSNQKLAKLVQKQIQDREKWQRMNELKQKQLQQNFSTIFINQSTQNSQENPLLVINNNESLKKATSKQKLQKISTQKFSALNLQKNNILNNQGEQQEYQNPQSPAKNERQDELNSPQRKKRSVSQLRPLKKKQSTFEVMNQMDMAKKKDSINISETFKRPMLKKRFTAKDIHNFESFNKTDLEKGMYLEGSFERNRSGVCNLLWPEYRMIFDNENIIYAKKTMRGYDIMLDPSHPDFLTTKKLGSVRGNFIGSHYNVYNGEEQTQILATIFYNPDSKCVTRQVQLYVKRGDLTYWDCDRDIEGDVNFYDLKTLYLQGDNRCDNKIRKYVSKQPYFDQKTNSYKLDFGGKATVLSIKNVVLIQAQNPKQKVFIFGKCGGNSFSFKAESPLSPMVIMGYLMSSFNFKFATQ